VLTCYGIRFRLAAWRMRNQKRGYPSGAALAGACSTAAARPSSSAADGQVDHFDFAPVILLHWPILPCWVHRHFGCYITLIERIGAAPASYIGVMVRSSR